MDTLEVVKFDEVYVFGGTKIFIVAPEPAPTQAEIKEILEEYKKTAILIRQEQIEGTE